MANIGLNNGKKTEYQEEPGGQFKKGNPGGGRPKGSTNKFSMAKLEEAIEAEEELAKKENGIGIFQQFIRMAYIEPSVMIALMKKFIPDKSHTELSGTEPIEITVKHIENKIEE